MLFNLYQENKNEIQTWVSLFVHFSGTLKDIIV